MPNDTAPANEQTPLFIPLKTEYYNAFCNGTKKVEYRKYGPGWNERTCQVGRRVVISKGYGRQHRRTGTIFGFKKLKGPTHTKAFRDCYGPDFAGYAACIAIDLDEPVETCHTPHHPKTPS